MRTALERLYELNVRRIFQDFFPSSGPTVNPYLKLTQHSICIRLLDTTQFPRYAYIPPFIYIYIALYHPFPQSLAPPNHVLPTRA